MIIAEQSSSLPLAAGTPARQKPAFGRALGNVCGVPQVPYVTLQAEGWQQRPHRSRAEHNGRPSGPFVSAKVATLSDRFNRSGSAVKASAGGHLDCEWESDLLYSGARL